MKLSPETRRRNDYPLDQREEIVSIEKLVQAALLKAPVMLLAELEIKIKKGTASGSFSKPEIASLRAEVGVLKQTICSRCMELKNASPDKSPNSYLRSVVGRLSSHTLADAFFQEIAEAVEKMERHSNCARSSSKVRSITTTTDSNPSSTFESTNETANGAVSQEGGSFAIKALKFAGWAFSRGIVLSFRLVVVFPFRVLSAVIPNDMPPESRGHHIEHVPCGCGTGSGSGSGSGCG